MSAVKNGEYTISYRGMRGVDFSAAMRTRRRDRFAFLQNMYRDYEGEHSDSVESIPGFRRIASFGQVINGIFSQKSSDGHEYTVVHSGNKIYRFKTEERDTLPSLYPIAEIDSTESSAFRFGYELYILYGSGILKICDDGTAERIEENSDSIYIPTVYYNKKRLEQRNLLTDNFIEKYTVGAAETAIYGTRGLMYKITSESLQTCAVVGISESFYGTVNIPSYANIAGKLYKVDEIADNAFKDNTSIIGAKIGIGVYRIGKHAFSGCTRLDSVKCTDSPAFIDDFAFDNCSMLHVVTLAKTLERVGEEVFRGCEHLISIDYESDLNDFKKIENSTSLEAFSIHCFGVEKSVTLEIPVMSGAERIIELKIGDEKVSSYSSLKSDGLITALLITISDREKIEGKEITILAASATEAGNGGDFLRDTEYLGGGFSAISRCTVCESFDGRVFLSGNPSLPGAVFFSSRDAGEKNTPLYFGSYNYFRDGMGVFGVSSMLASADSLIVFKSEDDGGGSIFYHTPKSTGEDFIPKIYPVSYTHNGIGCAGKSISFYDDPIFLSRSGATALDKKSINLERSIACRSHNVNARLLGEDLSGASLARWQGYLALGTRKGHIYLADSRATFLGESGSREYEWFYLSGIGTYENSTRVYRYSSIAPEGYKIHKEPEAEVTGEIYSDLYDEKIVYYTLLDGQKYTVYPSEEKRGGTFMPLTTLTSTDSDLLFFGTTNGDLCVFNNDKRGIAPERISSAPDFDAEDYKTSCARKIHPDFYAFADHSMLCGAETLKDDCSIPSLTKSTVKHSLTLKCKIGGRGRIRCEVGTDKSGYAEKCILPSGDIDFSDFSFDALSIDSSDVATIPISEKEKGWIEKSVAVYCEDFRSPIGIYSITYRYKPKGRIKHK